MLKDAEMQHIIEAVERIEQEKIADEVEQKTSVEGADQKTLVTPGASPYVTRLGDDGEKQHIIKAMGRAERKIRKKGMLDRLEAAKTSVPSPRDEKITYTQTRKVRISPSKLRENRVFLGTEDNAIVSVYKMLRTQVWQRMRENGWNTLGVTSCRAGEGKSLTAINLAMSLANALDHTVLLVDVDLRLPRIQQYFGCTQARGLTDCLLKEVALRDVLFNVGIEKLIILPGGNPIVNSSETLSSAKMTQFFKELRKRCQARLVLLDLPPLLVSDDVLAFAPHIDAVLLVVEKGKTPKGEIMRAMKLLEGTNVLGTILNKSESVSKSYY